MFCDYAKIKIEAGKGGDGSVSFLRDINKAHGGPDGGDGGKGGDIIFEVDPNMNTLSQFLRKKEYRADDGKNGGNKNMTGNNGQNLVIKVPLGTVVYEIDDKGSHKQVFDFHRKNLEYLVAVGGRGGFGNTRFKSSVRQAPKIRELGLPGEKKKLVLELKTIADVGLVGLPNSGKSTFLKAITKARPKIADYPFTTIIPNLGVIDYNDSSLTIADIPGLIEGASRGKGLGHDFLKHIERTRIILHLIDIQSPNPDKDYKTIRQELINFNPSLAKKPEIICLTKLDTTGWAPNDPDLKEYINIFSHNIQTKGKVLAISSISKKGINKLIQQLFSQAQKLPAVDRCIIKLDPRSKDKSRSWDITRKNNKFLITGDKIEEIALKTDFQSPDSIDRFYKILAKIGIEDELKKLKIKKGNSLLIGGKKIIWGKYQN